MKNNISLSTICPSCHKRINPFIGICLCGYELSTKPKLHNFRSYRPKKMSNQEWLDWIKSNYGDEIHKKALNSICETK